MSQKLYLANTSKLVQEVPYWVPGANKRYQETVPIGGQVEVCASRSLAKHEWDHVIEQFNRYGAIPVSELAKHKKFAGLCYQFDKPIDIEKIKIGVKANDDALTAEALEQRKFAAATQNHNLNEMTRGHVSEVEIELEEQEKVGIDKDVLHETVSAASEGVTPRKAGRGGRNKRN